MAMASPASLALPQGGEAVSPDPGLALDDGDEEGPWGNFTDTCPDDVHLRHGGGGGKGGDDVDERKWYFRVLCLRDTGARHCSVLDLDQYVRLYLPMAYLPTHIPTTSLLPSVLPYNQPLSPPRVKVCTLTPRILREQLLHKPGR